jgi:hypothetical protein
VLLPAGRDIQRHRSIPPGFLNVSHLQSSLDNLPQPYIFRFTLFLYQNYSTITMSSHHLDTPSLVTGSVDNKSVLTYTTAHQETWLPDRLAAESIDASHYDPSLTLDSKNGKYSRQKSNLEPHALNQTSEGSSFDAASAPVNRPDNQVQYKSIVRVWQTVGIQVEATTSFAKTPMERFEQERIAEQPWNGVSGYSYYIEQHNERGDSNMDEGENIGMGTCVCEVSDTAEK